MASTAGNYAAGVALAMFTTCMSALGMALQKLAHGKLDALVKGPPAAPLKGTEPAEEAKVKAGAVPGAATYGSVVVTDDDHSHDLLQPIAANHDGIDVRPASAVPGAQPRPAPQQLRGQSRFMRSVTQPLWLAGICLMIVSSLLSLAVFALVGQAVAASFAAITLVWAALFGRVLLKESLTRFDLAVNTVLITGAVTAVACGSRRDSSHDSIVMTPAVVAGLFGTTTVEVFSTLWAVVTATAMGAVYTIDRAKTNGGKVSDQAWLFTAYCRAFLAGTFSATTGLCSKGFTRLIADAGRVGSSSSSSSDPSNVTGSRLLLAIGAPPESTVQLLERYDFWLFLIFLVPSLGLQVTYLNSALARFPSTLVVPVYQSLIVVLGMVFGFVYWQEDEGMSTESLVGFVSGVALIVVGLGMLLVKHKRLQQA